MDAIKNNRLPPPGEHFEDAACYLCDGQQRQLLVVAEDDLTGKPGKFSFVRCTECGLAYQHPRLTVTHIKAYYDQEYIAHRKKTNWGMLTPLYQRAMDKHDRAKAALIKRYLALSATSNVLDVGCGAGTFLLKLRELYGAKISGVDFKDLSALPGFENIQFRCGLFYDQDFSDERFDLITMWHFLEHDYDPLRTLVTAHHLLAPDGLMVIEVPRLDSISYALYKERWPGLQAPQHTVLYSKTTLLAMLEKAGFDVLDYLPYGAFPAYFYLFAGLAFKWLKGRGLNLDRAIFPYFLGQLLLSPLLLFERHLNLSMQTVVVRPREAR